MTQHVGHRTSDEIHELCERVVQLIAERDEARAALKDCADDLESELGVRYHGTLGYPSEIRRFERDIVPVIKARAVLAKGPSDG
jgi:hypothetical protein